MTVDHAGKIVVPNLYEPTYLVGRLAFPLFAGIIALRLVLSPGLSGRYLRWLVPWALLSQPCWVLAGRAWTEGNILFTLALGVAAWRGVGAWRDRRAAPAAALLGVAVVAAPFVEYGLPGVAMLVATAALATRSTTAALLGIGPLGVLANWVPAPPHFEVADLAAVGASVITWLSVRSGGALPRAPRLVFYAYYPVHLLALHWTDLALRRPW